MLGRPAPETAPPSFAAPPHHDRRQRQD